MANNDLCVELFVELFAFDARYKSSEGFQTSQNKKMNREITDITDLALANILDLIPLITNTGDEINPIIFQIYERNAAVLSPNYNFNDYNLNHYHVNDSNVI